jgi:Family of unknown function (DUF5996)
MISETNDWPELPYAAWRETCETLHLWTQIVGKIRLAQTPWLNHSWHVALYVTSNGLTTSPIPHGTRSFEIKFDFIAHRLDIDVSDGARRSIDLQPQSVAAFYGSIMTALDDLGLPVKVREFPCEIAAAIDFSRDIGHASYDRRYVQRFWRILLQVDRIFKTFRTGFIGKSSPVHFFWGSFDLAVTRFSGRAAPPFSGHSPGLADAVMREAYSHEVSSAGFWPGGGGIDYPAFYSYAYPAAEGYRKQSIRPSSAFFDTKLGEYVLPYDAVRTAPNPGAALIDFLQTTYEAAALTAAWDRGLLECRQGIPGVARKSDPN